jgi:hypothetical protein
LKLPEDAPRHSLCAGLMTEEAKLGSKDCQLNCT